MESSSLAAFPSSCGWASEIVSSQMLFFRIVIECMSTDTLKQDSFSMRFQCVTANLINFDYFIATCAWPFQPRLLQKPLYTMIAFVGLLR